MGRFFTAIILMSFASTGLALTPSQAVQTKSKEQSAGQQVSSQTPGTTDQKLVETKPVETKTAFAPQTRQPAPEIELDQQPVVTPPAPLVVKKNANAIMVPTGLDSNVTSDSKYAERPVISSGVSVGSTFGYRRDPFTRRAKFHSGVDLKARWGDAVGASQTGTVEFAGWYHGYGNMIIISHGGGVTTHYAHLSSFDVEPGMHVERGTIIGRAGSTGRATSPHLHYEVRIDGNPMDPFQPLALDPSSDYFKSSRPTVDAGRGDAASTTGSMREK
jgi:murein DD-endopeptidase MepM/ murein hydrolase activator NlpD